MIYKKEEDDSYSEAMMVVVVARAHTILHRSYATQHGYDIIALSQNGVELIMEAKGQTSQSKALIDMEKSLPQVGNLITFLKHF